MKLLDHFRHRRPVSCDDVPMSPGTARVEDCSTKPFEWDEKAAMPFVRHRGGVWWHEAPIPPENHRCWVQTEDVGHVQRCACGAIRYSDRDSWMNRNERIQR